MHRVSVSINPYSETSLCVWFCSKIGMWILKAFKEKEILNKKIKMAIRPIKGEIPKHARNVPYRSSTAHTQKDYSSQIWSWMEVIDFEVITQVFKCFYKSHKYKIILNLRKYQSTFQIAYRDLSTHTTRFST